MGWGSRLNLASEIREVRGRLSSPSRLDSTNDRITDLEIMDWIHRAEIQALKDVVEREKVTAHLNFPAAVAELQGTATGFPLDILDIVRVVHLGVDCKRIPLRELGALTQNELYEPVSGYQQYWYQILRTDGTINFGVLPAPASGTIDLYYVKIPARRAQQVRGFTTGSGTAVQIFDTAKLGQVDNHWQGREIMLSDGAYPGEVRQVTFSNKSASRLTVGVAFPEAVPAGVHFDLGEKSQMPPDMQDLVIAWATYIGLLKDKEIQMAQSVRGEYEAYLDKINRRYGFTREEPQRQPETARTL